MNLNVFFPKNLSIESIENNEHNILIHLKSESAVLYVTRKVNISTVHIVENH